MRPPSQCGGFFEEHYSYAELRTRLRLNEKSIDLYEITMVVIDKAKISLLLDLSITDVLKPGLVSACSVLLCPRVGFDDPTNGLV